MTDTALNMRALGVGDELPSWVSPPITRHTLALYCGASGDYNPIHVDIDFAHAAGMPDVFAHGMLSMAYLAHVLTQWADVGSIRSYGVRFVAITHVGDLLTCRAQVAERLVQAGEQCLRLTLTASDQRGQIKLQGEAVVAEPVSAA